MSPPRERAVDPLDRLRLILSVGPSVAVWNVFRHVDEDEGLVVRERYPVLVWLLNGWLQRGHPHWRWWRALWGLLRPIGGDPICEAYCRFFNGVVGPSSTDAHQIIVPMEALPYDAYFGGQSRGPSPDLPVTTRAKGFDHPRGGRSS